MVALLHALLGLNTATIILNCIVEPLNQISFLPLNQRSFLAAQGQSTVVMGAQPHVLQGLSTAMIILKSTVE